MEDRRQRGKEKQVSPIYPWDHMCQSAREARQQPHKWLPLHEASTGRKKKKNLTLVVCFLLLLKGEIKKMSDTCSLFPSLETPGLPACYPLTIPWTAACQASLSLTISWSLLKLMSIESVISSNHFSSCHPLLLLSSIFPSIRVFSNELVLHIGWPKYWSFSLRISPWANH